MFRYGFRKHISDLGVDYADKVLVAVSGGVDSMCLLDALVHCQMDLDISVAHVNFNLRGEESDADTAMVVKWCGENNILLHTVSFETKEYASENGISVEMAARELRYSWFYELMQQNGYKFLAIAHNANDNAETLLLNLTRGCGIEGIGGIQEKVLLEFADQDATADTQQTADTGSSAGTPQAADHDATAGTECAAKEKSATCGQQFIIRPLLCYSRQQIEKYALKFKVPFRTDSTNLLSDYSRNRIRNEVFPQLAKLNPSVIATFNNNIKHFRQAGNIMQRHIEEKCAQLCHRFGYFQDLLESRFSHNFCGLNLRLNCVEAEEEKYSMIVCIVEIAQLLEEAE
ncbi:MAG: tRNA lysidine(34) synthetase TilS [Bacteroidales bacterium]|nr:tRNA lysidine(34) synthetase TilS [Bacteroidales bacterium]